MSVWVFVCKLFSSLKTPQLFHLYNNTGNPTVCVSMFSQIPHRPLIGLTLFLGGLLTLLYFRDLGSKVKVTRVHWNYFLTCLNEIGCPICKQFYKYSWNISSKIYFSVEGAWLSCSIFRGVVMGEFRVG